MEGPKYEISLDQNEQEMNGPCDLIYLEIREEELQHEEPRDVDMV